MTVDDIDDVTSHPSLVDGNLTIYFETPETRKADLALPIDHPNRCLPFHAADDPSRPYPEDATIPRTDIARILAAMRALCTASVNLFNGMVSLTFSCDGSHYMRYDEFLAKGATFWTGTPR